jgi:hypothetical protein
MNGLSACPEASEEVVHEHRQAGLSSKHKGVEEHRNHAGTMSAHPDAPVYSGPRNATVGGDDANLSGSKTRHAHALLDVAQACQPATIGIHPLRILLRRAPSV